MATVNFNPTLREIRDVLKADLYQIPRFQRPYSWSPENLDEFWNDAIVDNTDGYFIGPMVCYEMEKGLHGIVDGQQRMTTITLAICAIRDMFAELGEKLLADGIQPYIERPDDDSLPHFVLKSGSAGEYLQTQFQLPALDRVELAAANDEHRALRSAFKDIGTRLRASIEGLEITTTTDASSEAALRLREIRDKILSLRVIWIQLDNEDDAYIVFETLNSRGKDLETVDLLKNHLLGKIRESNGDIDTARVMWDKMRQHLVDDGGNAPVNAFIHHWWLTRDKYVAERKVFSEIKRSNLPGNSLLKDLQAKAEIYARIAEPRQWGCSRELAGVRNSLLAMNTFSVRQPRPFLLALLHAHRAGQVSTKQLKRAVSAVEAFHFITTAVVGESSTGGISQMYARHARDLGAAAGDESAVAAVVDGLRNQLRGKVANRQSFLASFPEKIRYSASEPKVKRLTTYTLRKIQESKFPNSPLDPEKANIEHIASQSDGAEPWIHSIGNLVWVGEVLNKKLDNLPFDQKLPLFKANASGIDVADVVVRTIWDKSTAAERADALAAYAYDQIWFQLLK